MSDGQGNGREGVMANEDEFYPFQIVTYVAADDSSWNGVSVDKEWLYVHVPSGIVVTDRDHFLKWLRNADER